MFQQPSAGSDFRAKDHIGHLLLIYVRELRENIVTQYGTSDAISADVVVLTDPSGPRCETQVLFFQKPLIGSLRNSIGGEPVLARLGQGTAKPGQSAPYILNPYTEQDAAIATQYLQSVGGNPFVPAPAFAQAPVPATPPAPAATPAPAMTHGSITMAPPAQQPTAPSVAAAPMPTAPAPVPQAAPPAPAPAAGGQQLTPEAAAAIQALGIQLPPAAPTSG